MVNDEHHSESSVLEDVKHCVRVHPAQGHREGPKLPHYEDIPLSGE